MRVDKIREAHAFHREIGLECVICFLLKEIETLWDENKKAYKGIDELARRHLINQNNVRGTDRFLNSTEHFGRKVNV